MCKRLAAEIAAPEYSLAAMASDAPGKRSIQVTHRNLAKLWLRAYTVDLDARLKSARDYNLLPAWQEIETMVGKQKPVASWSVELAPTPDHRDHRTFVTPRTSGPTSSSLGRSIAEQPNRRAAVNILIGDLVLLSQRRDQGVDVRVLSGGSGRPVAGATVELWDFDWGKGHHRNLSVKTDAAGEAAVRWQDQDRPHFLVAR